MARPPESSSSVAPERFMLIDAIAHPVRGRVLSALCERPDLTIREVAEHMAEPIRRVRHHVNVLVSSGLVEVTGEEHRRGVVERRYGRERPIEIADMDGFSDEQRLRLAVHIVALLLDDIRVAARAGTLGSRGGRWQARFYGEVDDMCVKELDQIHLRAHLDIAEALHNGRERIRRSGRPGTEVVSAHFFFEAPLWGSAPSSHDPDAD